MFLQHSVPQVICDTASAVFIRCRVKGQGFRRSKPLAPATAFRDGTASHERHGGDVKDTDRRGRENNGQSIECEGRTARESRHGDDKIRGGTYSPNRDVMQMYDAVELQMNSPTVG